MKDILSLENVYIQRNNKKKKMPTAFKITQALNALSHYYIIHLIIQ